MESVLGWFGDIFRALISLFPHLFLIRATNKGLKFKRGGKVQVCEPGLHWYIPAITDLEDEPITVQTIDLHDQRLTTKSGKTVVVGGIVQFQIFDIEAAFLECEIYEDMIKNDSISVIKNVVNKNSFEYLMNNPQEVDEHLKEQLDEITEGYGIEVIKLTLSDLAPCLVICT